MVKNFFKKVEIFEKKFIQTFCNVKSPFFKAFHCYKFINNAYNRQICEAQSLHGPKNCFTKYGHDLYTVQNADINGDSIHDIIIRNKSGKNIIVNGYTTAESIFP